MAGVLTKEDFQELEKRFVTKDELKRELKSFATKVELHHSVAVLEQKIDRSRDDILGAINAAMDHLIHRAEFAGLEHRVTVLERKAS